MANPAMHPEMLRLTVQSRMTQSMFNANLFLQLHKEDLFVE